MPLIMLNEQVKHLQKKQAIKKLEELEMAKMGASKLIEIELDNGDKMNFKLQHLGVRNTHKMIQATDKDTDARISYLLDHVIFTEDNGKVTWDTFEEINNGFKVLNDVVAQAITFLTGIEPK